MNKIHFAFIFARGGSKGIKKKNLIDFRGKPLIYYSISIAKKLGIFKKIYVCTDDNEIANYSKKLNVDVIKRPKYLARDNSPEFLSWKFSIGYLDKKKIEFDTFVSLPTTSPLRVKSDIKKAIKKLKNKTDIVVCATKSNRNPWFNMVKKKDDGYYTLVNKSSNTISSRQKAPKVYDLTTIAYVTKPEYIRKSKSIFHGKVDINLVSKINSIDIDDYEDLYIANKLAKR